MHLVLKPRADKKYAQEATLIIFYMVSLQAPANKGRKAGPVRTFAPIVGTKRKHPAQRGGGGGGGDVFARVSELEAHPEQLDEMNREGVEHILPALRMQAGFNGGLVLADRKSGKVLAMTFWETEQAMDATEEAAHWLLSFGAEAAGGMIKGVGR